MSINALSRINAIEARLSSMKPRALSNAVPLGGVPSTSVDETVAVSSALTSPATSTVSSTASMAFSPSRVGTAPTFATALAGAKNSDVEVSTRNGSERTSAVTPFADLFNAAGAKYGISPRLLASVATIESSFNTKAVSPAGAQGLMQFMPSTAAGMGVDPWDPASAIDGAARLLVGHRDRFGSIASALAAYNEGGGTVARYGGKVPPQTQGYVDKILNVYRGGSS